VIYFRSSVVTKIVITVTVGAVSFPLTNLLFASGAEQLAMTAAVGGAILIVQFLIDLERKLDAVERSQIMCVEDIKASVDLGFAKISDATQLFGRMGKSNLEAEMVTELVRNASDIKPGLPPLVSALVQSELRRVSGFLHGVAGGEPEYDGEDRDWLLGLAGVVRTSIDACSLSTVDALGSGFWGSDLGRRYLTVQREAVQRGVHVRRVFIREEGEPIDRPELREFCALQRRLGIEVRILDFAVVQETNNSYLYDFSLFDDSISYEIVSGLQMGHSESPAILNTRLVIDQQKVADRISKYDKLWGMAEPFVQ
jgi:hypothetical protein